MYVVFTDQHVTCATTADEQKAIDYVDRLNKLGTDAHYTKLEEEE